MNPAHESKTPVVLFPKDKNKNKDKADEPKDVTKRIGILQALAKSMAKSNARM